MEEHNGVSDAHRQLSEAPDPTAARRPWRAPELVKVDVADSTQGGNIVNPPTESLFYKLS